MSDVELVSLQLPADKLRYAHERLKKRGGWFPEEDLGELVRAIVRLNPLPEPPLQTGDWVKVGGVVAVVADVLPSGGATAVWCDHRGRGGWHRHDPENWERCGPPFNPAVRAALLGCIGRTEEDQR